MDTRTPGTVKPCGSLRDRLCRLTPLLLLGVALPWLRAPRKPYPRKTLASDTPEVIDSVRIVDPYLLRLHTNWKAPQGRILALDLKNSARDLWQEVVPEGGTDVDCFYT